MIYLGCDHGGFALKQELHQFLTAQGYPVTDCGSVTYDADDDFTTAVPAVVQGVLADPANCGILVCGSGVGMSIAANRYCGIRAALCPNVDYARLSRQHNDANVLCLGGRFLDINSAKKMVTTFLTTAVDPDPKYQRRMQQADRSN